MKTRIEVTIPAGPPPAHWLRIATKRARAAAAQQGVSWEDADVFVSLPEPGRCFAKSPGRTALVAIGQSMKNGNLTRALRAAESAGLTLRDALNPAREDDFLRAPGIGRKMLGILRDESRAAPQTTGRGGPGRGQGRKPLVDGEETVTVSMRMTASQRDKLAALGGASWVRGKINSA